MANYYSNTVLLLGNEHAVAELRHLFWGIQHQQQLTNMYYLPDFVNDGTGYLEDISFSGHRINYESRWTPNHYLLTQLAEHYHVDFITGFDEKSSGIYGEALYTNGELISVSRDAKDKKAAANDPSWLAFRAQRDLVLEAYRETGYELHLR